MNASWFLPADESVPEWPSWRRRRVLATLAGALMAAGAVAAGYEDRRIEPVREPGPRRYPLGYWAKKPAG
jgi:hypothetical protein